MNKISKQVIAAVGLLAMSTSSIRVGGLADASRTQYGTGGR